jgi:NAD(P)-dependent dehydrogenase (short-subunit alcohol dehydrogenase family)
MSELRPKAAVILGARNLGAALATDLLGRDVRVAVVARTPSDLAILRARGAVTIPADASDPDSLAAALERASSEIGRLDLIVNAVSPARPAVGATAFGGGPIAAATVDAMETWTVPVAQQTLVFLGAAARALDGHGTLIQVTGAPARRTNPERGLVSAGMAAVRALTHAAAQELRESGIHVALLIVDGIIESPKTEAMAARLSPDALVRHDDVAHAVDFLATQSQRGMTHELVVTPVGGRWVP